ncbi:MAG TPA: flagellar basal body rod protein FlgC [Ensifer sp.]|nr:flagellar basal body rod protein FlgC [Ensifer sp.]
MIVDPLSASLKISASGMDAQSTRLRIVSENLANVRSTGETPGSEPYRRKMVSFAEHVNKATGVAEVKIQKVFDDMSSFNLEFDPGNPAANKDGYVKMPNVNPLIEMADMREANRSYEANLQAIKQARDMISSTIDLLRSSS